MTATQTATASKPKGATPAAVNGNGAARPPRKLPTWTRDEIAQRIVNGQALVLRRDVVLNVGSWMSFHPGGALALLHFVGRDASDEIAGYHSDSTLDNMRKFAVARVDIDPELGWAPLSPPISLGLVQHPDGVKGHWAREGHVRLAKAKGGLETEGAGTLVVETLSTSQLEPVPVPSLDRKREYARSKAYHELKEKVVKAGLFKAPGPLAGYGKDAIRCSLLAASSAYLFFRTDAVALKLLSAALLGLMWQQLTFIVHDAGHSGITGTWHVDRAIASTLAAFIGGLSANWWCDNHDIHHLVTNHPEHDPDIQHIPFFAITSQFFRSMWSTYYKRVMKFDKPSRFLLQFQHKLYYIVLSLARFNLYFLSYAFLFSAKAKHDWLWSYEIAGLTFYWLWFGSLLRACGSWQMGLGFLLVSHICASPVHVQIVLSHFACSTDDLGPQESFPSRQLRTTMDVECSESIEFIHGGLHLQVTHHMFPRLPRHNLRKASLLVKEYCKDNEIDYLEHGWIHGNMMVLDTLRDVANQLQILKQVADKEIDELVDTMN